MGSNIPNLYQLDQSSNSPLISPPQAEMQAAPSSFLETHESIRTTVETTRSLNTNMKVMPAMIESSLCLGRAERLVALEVVAVW